MEREPLKAGDTGPHAEIAPRPLPEGLVLLFMPALAAPLTRAEQLKGAPVTREALLRIRDVAGGGLNAGKWKAAAEGGYSCRNRAPVVQ